MAKPIISYVNDIPLTYSISKEELKKLHVGERFIKAVHKDGRLIILKLSNIEQNKIDGYIRNFENVKNLINVNIIDHIEIHRLQDSKYSFSVMEVLECANSGNIVSHLRALNFEQLLEAFKQIFKGFIFLHKNGVLHRDIKLNNILVHMIGDKKVYKIADLEFWPPGNNEILRTTPEFLAPEATSYNLYTIQSEIWAIGAMLYEMFTGNFPFGSRKKGYSTEQIRANAMNEIKSLVNIPIPFQQIIEISLRKDLDHRAHSVVELSKMLTPFAILKFRLQSLYQRKDSK